MTRCTLGLIMQLFPVWNSPKILLQDCGQTLKRKDSISPVVNSLHYWDSLKKKKKLEYTQADRNHFPWLRSVGLRWPLKCWHCLIIIKYLWRKESDIQWERTVQDIKPNLQLFKKKTLWHKTSLGPWEEESLGTKEAAKSACALRGQRGRFNVEQY